MNRSGQPLLNLLILALTLLAAPQINPAHGAPQQPPPPIQPTDVSFQLEVQRAISRGLDWLRKNQDPSGYWSTPDHPAITALALMCFQGDPSGRFRQEQPGWMTNAYNSLLQAAHEDGGIHQNQLLNYNTAISLMALLGANNPGYKPVILKARQFVIRMQMDFGEKGTLDSPLDGGVGYGGTYPHSDMASTLQALEALHYSRHLVQDQPGPASNDLNWAAAIHFLQSCQNLPSHNKEPWASDDPANKGGFVYFPGNSKAGTVTNETTGKVALRSYGSISYAGMLSYIYADLKPGDPRVQAVFQWLQQNYTLKENPGMGAQGLYYYFHTMAKALTAYNVSDLILADGQTVNWRHQLATRLINLQQADGSWLNTEHGRWWEKDPALVTAYATLALELIHKGL